MTKTRDLADLGGGFIQAGTGAVQRTVESKLQDVISVKDFGAVGDGNADDTAAIQAAFDYIANERSGFGVIVFDGKFKVTSTITVSCWNLVLKGGSGAGEQGVINTTAAARVFDVTLTNAYGKLVVQDFSVNPLSIAGPAPSFVRLTVPSIASSPYSNLFAQNITVTNQANNAGEPKTFETVFELDNCWQARIYNCFYFARTIQPAVDGKGCLVKLINRCIDTTLTNCLQQNGSACVYQTAYSEGVNLINCLVVASDWVITQSPSLVADPTTGLKLNQVMATACEFNTYRGSFNLDRTKYIHAQGCSHTKHSDGSGPDWTAYALQDVQNVACVGDCFIGGAAGGTRRAIKLTYNNRSCDTNAWSGGIFNENLDYLADIGANVLITSITGFSANHADNVLYSKIINSGTNTVLGINGINSFKAGSAAVPSVWFDGSATSGFYSPATNVVAYSGQGTERLRLTAGGYFKASPDGTYNNATSGYHELRQTAAPRNVFAECTSGTYAETVYTAAVVRSATNAYKFFQGWSGNFGDLEFNLEGDGNGKCDGAWTGGGADYAEYFEWSDGNPDEQDRRGISVVLDGDKIREALPGEEPIGVVSGNPSVVGDAAWNKWSGKYLRDEFGTYIQEDYEAEDEDGRAITQQRRKLNPAYDPEAEYIPREQRPEWGCVGLMGKLRVRKGQPVAPSWVKMKDISDTVEEWLIR